MAVKKKKKAEEAKVQKFIVYINGDDAWDDPPDNPDEVYHVSGLNETVAIMRAMAFRSKQRIYLDGIDAIRVREDDGEGDHFFVPDDFVVPE